MEARVSGSILRILVGLTAVVAVAGVFLRKPLVDGLTRRVVRSALTRKNVREMASMPECVGRVPRFRISTARAPVSPSWQGSTSSSLTLAKAAAGTPC